MPLQRLINKEHVHLIFSEVTICSQQGAKPRGPTQMCGHKLQGDLEAVTASVIKIKPPDPFKWVETSTPPVLTPKLCPWLLLSGLSHLITQTQLQTVKQRLVDR